PKPLPWDQLKSRLDENQPFNMMRGTPYYRDAVYEQFSAQEYARRYTAIRAKMREHKLDCVIVPGGPSHWSFGGGMLWLTGHWEWHAVANYVVVPLEGDPTLVYSMGGTHAEAVRRETAAALSDVRQRGRCLAPHGFRMRAAHRIDQGRVAFERHHDVVGDSVPFPMTGEPEHAAAEAPMAGTARDNHAIELVLAHLC